MREPNWMLVSVVVLGVVTVVLASIWESTYDVRHCASDDARRSGNGSWYFSCLIAAVPVLFILTGSVTESFEFRDESVEVEESVQIAALDGNSYISGHIGGYSFMGTGGASGEVKEDDAYTVMVSDGNGGYEKRRYGVDEVKVIFDSTEEDARVEEVDVVRNYDVTRSPFFAFDMKGECREVEHQTHIHVPEGSWGEHQFSVN
jgi:hypothetical protein